MKFLLLKIKFILKQYRKNFQTVNWYEFSSKKIRSKIQLKGKKLIVLSKFKNNSQYQLKDYFIKYKNKKRRFKKKNYFLILVKNKMILSTGWLYIGSKWKLEEVNKNIQLKNKYLLYDFETPKKIRNKGYYKMLLKLIIKKFNSKVLAIYSLSSNKNSITAIT